MTKTIDLELHTRDGHELLARVRWRSAVTEILDVVPVLRADLQRMVEGGILEWIGPADDPRPRLTTSQDPRFLDRLADYLRKQTGPGFRIKLREAEVIHLSTEPPRKRTNTDVTTRSGYRRATKSADYRQTILAADHGPTESWALSRAG